MRPDIVPGAAFPDYELPDHRGKRRTLLELQQGDPLVLMLSRAGFSPRGNTRSCCSSIARCRRGYFRLVTISADNLLETNEFRAGVGAQWTFLSDPGRKLQKDLDIAEYTPHLLRGASRRRLPARLIPRYRAIPSSNRRDAMSRA